MRPSVAIALMVIGLGVALLFLAPDWFVWGALIGNVLVFVGIVAVAYSLISQRKRKSADSGAGGSS